MPRRRTRSGSKRRSPLKPRRRRRLGLVSNFFGGPPTTIHLHFEIRQIVKEADGTVRKRFVPPYASLVDAYIRLLEGEEDDPAPSPAR